MIPYSCCRGAGLLTWTDRMPHGLQQWLLCPVKPWICLTMACSRLGVQRTLSYSKAGNTASCSLAHSMTGYSSWPKNRCCTICGGPKDAAATKILWLFIWHSPSRIDRMLVQVVVRNGTLLEATPPDYRELDYMPSELRYVLPRALSSVSSQTNSTLNRSLSNTLNKSGSGPFSSFSQEQFRQVLICPCFMAHANIRGCGLALNDVVCFAGGRKGGKWSPCNHKTLPRDPDHQACAMGCFCFRWNCSYLVAVRKFAFCRRYKYISNNKIVTSFVCRHIYFILFKKPKWILFQGSSLQKPHIVLLQFAKESFTPFLSMCWLSRDLGWTLQLFPSRRVAHMSAVHPQAAWRITPRSVDFVRN